MRESEYIYCSIASDHVHTVLCTYTVLLMPVATFEFKRYVHTKLTHICTLSQKAHNTVTNCIVLFYICSLYVCVHTYVCTSTSTSKTYHSLEASMSKFLKGQPGLDSLVLGSQNPNITYRVNDNFNTIKDTMLFRQCVYCTYIHKLHIS